MQLQRESNRKYNSMGIVSFCLVTAIQLLSTKAEQVHFHPPLPYTFLKSKVYVFELTVSSKNSNVTYVSKQLSGPTENHWQIIKGIWTVNTNSLLTGKYKFEILVYFKNRKLSNPTAVEFFLVDSKDVKPNTDVTYFVTYESNVLFHFQLQPSQAKSSDFTTKFNFENTVFYYKNDTMFIHYFRKPKYVYTINIQINYVSLKETIVIGTWEIFVFFPVNFRKRISDEEMDSPANKDTYEVDYNDKIYKNAVPGYPFRPAIPNPPLKVATFIPDYYNNGTPLFKISGLVMTIWLLILLGLLIITVVFGKCQNFVWIPKCREIVRINPFGGPITDMEMCFFDYWLSVVGHDRDQRHCFAEMWEETFDELFPLGICSACLTNAANLIFEDRLIELVAFDNTAVCMDPHCRFRFFQTHLKMYSDRIPGFECESCSKEAYITILKWAE